MTDWSKLKIDDNFYDKQYWEWQSKGIELGGKIQADVLFQEYIKTDGKIIIYVPSMEDELGKLRKQNNKYDKNDRDNHLFNWNFQLLANLLIKCEFNLIDCKTKAYSRTYKSDNAYKKGGKELFIKVASRENVHPQTFVYAEK